MDSEIKSLEKNDTWQIVHKPKDKKTPFLSLNIRQTEYQKLYEK